MGGQLGRYATGCTTHCACCKPWLKLLRHVTAVLVQDAPLPSTPCQVYDGLLLPGELNDYEEAFSAVDKSGNGTIGECRVWMETQRPVRVTKDA